MLKALNQQKPRQFQKKMDSTYAASKAAVMAFTDCLQAELQSTGVSTLCLITPGIKTRMFDEIASKFGKHLEIPMENISAEKYADRIRSAILADKTKLYPQGSTYLNLVLTKYLNFVFKKYMSSKKFNLFLAFKKSINFFFKIVH
jgi:short-subunit dehydrogenase